MRLRRRNFFYNPSNPRRHRCGMGERSERESHLHIVLYEPDIPWNTGNVGRTCIATDSTLHLIGKLGFSLDAKEVRRSGLDYWEKVRLVRHDSWDAFLVQEKVAKDRLFLFSKKGITDVWSARFTAESYLVFGCETKGLPEALLNRYTDCIFRIPMAEDSVRSLNLSTSVGIALYEVLRQHRVAGSLG